MLVHSQEQFFLPAVETDHHIQPNMVGKWRKANSLHMKMSEYITKYRYNQMSATKVVAKQIIYIHVVYFILYINCATFIFYYYSFNH